MFGNWLAVSLHPLALSSLAHLLRPSPLFFRFCRRLFCRPSDRKDADRSSADSQAAKSHAEKHIERVQNAPVHAHCHQVLQVWNTGEYVLSLSLRRSVIGVTRII